MTVTRPVFGPELSAEGVYFRLWAPSQSTVGLQLGDASPLPMRRLADGWHERHVAEAGEGTRYGFVVGEHQQVPDPASRSNPDGVHGLSEVVDAHRYRWQDGGWRGRPWHEAVLYELHIGTFTDEGSFASAAERLQDLADLGVTAIELMPVAACPGTRNWGYDGVLHFAPQPAYGRPDDLRRFVDRAHGLGLMVLLDVVYNHFGPDGNFLHGYCPEFFNPKHQTPWGAAINFDGDQCEAVRAFYVANALHWVEDYHFDGLRLDAVHAIADDSARHIVLEIADALRDGPGQERCVHLVLENERNQASLLLQRGDPSAGATAQWNDDFHHVTHVVLTGETDSYYADYADEPVHLLARSLAEGFAYQGQPSPFRDGRDHGESTARLPTTAFVSFLQNHDQIGNRAFGDRLSGLADERRLEAAYACLLLSPHIPMLFMGEEFAATSPFLYFCDFDGELAAAVSRGRRAEFGRFAAFADPKTREQIPDPIAMQTFIDSKLTWSEREHGVHAARLDLVRRLLQLRRRWLWPELDDRVAPGRFRSGADAFEIEWTLAHGAGWRIQANFGTAPRQAERPDRSVTVYASAGVTLTRASIELEPAAVWVGRSEP